MTDDTNDLADEQYPDDMANTGSTEPDGPHQLGVTDFAVDLEDSGTVVVIAETGKQADQHTVAAAGETVAELNPNYPADDDVLFCVYRNALDSHFGNSWRTAPPTYLAFQVGDHGVPVYSFPRSRLDPTEDTDDTDNTDQETDAHDE